MESLVIFLIWLVLAAIGIIASVKKKARQQAASTRPQGNRQRWEEEIERRIRDFQDQLGGNPTATASMEEPVAVEESLENEPSEPISRPQPAAARPETAAAPAAAAAPAKDKDMDFDPVEMVVYSEVMKPGYEKY